MWIDKLWGWPCALRLSARGSLAVVGGLLLSAQAISQVDLDQITRLELDALEDGARTQKQIDLLDDKRMDAANKYRTILKQNTKLETYNDHLQMTVQSQYDDIASLRNQISRISNLERDVVPLMSDMLDALESFVALDLPFLLEERLQRLQNLRGLFADARISNAEKYRRILEAYQIENDYGRTIEAYDGFLTSAAGEESQHVTFLKIGRVAYLYQTRDGERSFLWSSENNTWSLLNGKHNSHVSEGIKMAREQIPSNLMFVPISETTFSAKF